MSSTSRQMWYSPSPFSAIHLAVSDPSPVAASSSRYVSPTGYIAIFVRYCGKSSSYSSVRPSFCWKTSMASLRFFTARATCSTRLTFMTSPR